jgi:hypothetical protein
VTRTSGRPLCIASAFAAAFAAAAGLAAAALLTATPALAAGTGIVMIPIRWCAVEGTSAVLNPQCASQASTSSVLWMRNVFTSHFHALPFCRLSWRSAAQQNMVAVPVIPDPCDPTVNAACPGQKGDFLDGASEMLPAINKCKQAWLALGVGEVGVVGINLRRYVDASGTPISTFGHGGVPMFADPNTQASSAGAFTVVDNDFILPAPYGKSVAPCLPEVGSPVPPWDGHEAVVGHEAGHSISLNHVAGTLMNFSVPAPELFTTGNPGQTDVVCPNPVPPLPLSQCGQMRLQALCAVNGVNVDAPPAVGGLVLTLGDAAPAQVDLHEVGATDDAATGRASFFWEAGLFAAAEQGTDYCVAVDRDSNPGTGGDPASIGIDLPLPGADLVGCVTVDAGPPGPGRVVSGVASLWEYAGGAFVARPSIAARADELAFETEASASALTSPAPTPPAATATPFITVMSLAFDRTLLATGGGPVPESFLVQALSRRSSGPGSERTAAARIDLRRPVLPECRVTPAAAARGVEVEVTAGGLPPNHATRVLLGPDAVAAGRTAADGTTVSRFVIGSGARSGWTAISIGIDDADSAVTADCALEILPPPAGTVPDGAVVPGVPLRVAPAGAGDLRLTWDASCSSGAVDYEVYEGSIGDFTSHAPRLCSTAGATTATLTPAAGNTYYLVVPANGVREGSYGRRSDGFERPPGALACAPQDPGVCP